MTEIIETAMSVGLLMLKKTMIISDYTHVQIHNHNFILKRFMQHKIVLDLKGNGIMARLTPQEKKTILTLHNEGKNIKQIIEATGRSREAITRLFVDCGIGEGSCRLDERIWDLTYSMYNDELRRQTGRSLRYGEFEKLVPSDEKAQWFKTAHKEYMDRAQLYVDTIMGNDISITKPKEQPEEGHVIKLTDIEYDILKKLADIHDLHNLDMLAGFIIVKEYTLNKKKED